MEGKKMSEKKCREMSVIAFFFLLLDASRVRALAGLSRAVKGVPR